MYFIIPNCMYFIQHNQRDPLFNVLYILKGFTRIVYLKLIYILFRIESSQTSFPRSSFPSQVKWPNGVSYRCMFISRVFYISHKYNHPHLFYTHYLNQRIFGIIYTQCPFYLFSPILYGMYVYLHIPIY